MPDGRQGVFDALGRCAGAAGSNSAGQSTGAGSSGSAGVAAGLDRCATQVGANESDPIPLSGDAPLTDLEGFAGTPPRLVRALNTTPVVDAKTLPLYAEMAQAKGAPLDFAAPGSHEIRYLVRHIYARLSQPFVDEDGNAAAGSPWLGPDGGAKPGEAVDADEHWARRVEEAFSLLPYTLPVTAYTLSEDGMLQMTDARMLTKLQETDDSGDVAYSLALECQQSVTLAAQSRGFDLPVSMTVGSDGVYRPALDQPFTAGPSEPQTNSLSPRGEARWVRKEKGTIDLVRLDPAFGPGSAFSFNSSASGGGQSATDHPHIAFVVRARRDAQGRVRAVQFFDVGGMNVPEVPHPAIKRAVHGYDPPEGKSVVKQDGVFNYAYPWAATGKAGALGAYAGHSVLSASPSTLARGLDRLKEARPLGLAQLLLVRRHNPTQNRPVDLKQDPITEWLLYASPMMLMYEDPGDPYEPSPNYAPARYLWSLRDLPGAEHIQAIWQISAPRSHLADAMAFGRGKGASRVPTTRSTTLLEMVTDAAARTPTPTVWPKWSIPTDPSKPLPAIKAVLGLLDLSVAPDGQVYVHDACRTPYDNPKGFQHTWRDNPPIAMPGATARGALPWGQSTTHAATVDLSTFTDLPIYFADVAPAGP